MKKLILSLLAVAAAAPAHAGGYIQQSTFSVPAGSIEGIDRDLVGNLYVLGRPAGAATYRVTGYQTQGITPQFSFDTGISTFAAFAVEDSGIVDVVDVSSGFALKRFTNTGTFISQSTYSLNASPYVTPIYLSTAIDKVNHRVYLTYQFTNNIYRVLGGSSSGPSTVTYGFINQYDFNGNQLLSTQMSGNSNAAGTCYTPSVMATDPQGNLYVADPNCQKVVEYSLSGSQTSIVPASWVTNFQPRGLWTDSSSNLYISEPVCGPAGCVPGVVKLAGGSLQTSFVADSAVGGAWDQRVLFLASSGAQPLRRFVYDGAPSVSPETAPLGSTAQHSPSATFAWQAANDPDGDPIVYAVYLGVSPSQLALAGTTSQTSFASQPLTFGVTYYWQVVAQDSYLGLPLQQTPAPVESFNLGFVNNPPGAFSVAGGTGTLVTRSTSAALSWQASVDSDGDPVVYDVSWLPASQSSATIITTALTSQIMTGLSFGTTYTWSVSARDNYGALTPMSGGAQALRLVFKNSPPDAIGYLTAPTSFHTTSPVVDLSWLPSSDPDGDPVSYQLDVQTTTGALPSLALGAATDFKLGVQYETTYYYRVEASDPYGGVSTGAWVSYVAHLANRAPNPIVYTSPSSVTSRVANFALTWQDSGDPDGDAVTYGVYLSTDPAAQALVQQASLTSYSLSLLYGTTVYWRVSAVDSFGARTDGPLQTFLPIFRNSPPPAPTATGGTGVLLEHTLAPQAQLAWSPVQDPDGDAVSYQLSVGLSSASLSPAQGGTQTSYALPNPAFGTTYYWQVSAIDAYGAASTGPVQNLLLGLQNSPPSTFAPLAGVGTLTTRGTAVTLSWAAASDPDGDVVTYALSLSTNPNAPALVAQSTATTYSLGFQFGTTYYWSVSAFDGFGGTTTITGGTQSFLAVFKNSPPSVPNNQSKTGTILYHGFTPSQSFFWQSATDPDGDPITYSLSYGTDSAHLAVLSPIPLGFTLSNLALNTAYFYRIVATDNYGAASDSPLNWVFYQFADNPPGSFDVIGTTGTVLTRDMGATLSWTASVDPDGDPVTYRVLLGTSAAGLAPLLDTPKTSAALQGLVFGTTYFWRVDAYDGFGATTTVNEGTQSLLHLFSNAPPPAPAILSGSGVFSEHSLAAQAHLSWTGVQDPDADPVAYQLYVGTAVSSLAAVKLSSPTSYDLASAQFGTTYYWQVSAADPFGAASTSAVQSLLLSFQNNPPAPFAVLGGTGTLATRTTAELLAWSPTTDPDGDTVTYALSVSTSPGALALVQSSTATSYTLGFQFGTTYYWSVAAFDGFGGTTTIAGGIQSFLPVFLNQAPGVVQFQSPFNGSPTITTMRNTVTISWSQVTTPQNDPVTYTVSLGDSAGDVQPVVQIGQTAQAGAAALSVRTLSVKPQAQASLDGNTITLTLTGLDYYRTYYLRVLAMSTYGATSQTPVQTFTLASANGFPRAYNYPNPFSPARGGTNIVFNAPPSGYARATVSVYSELGELLFVQDYTGVAPGISQVPFAGRDRYGRPLYNGSYVCRVRFFGPDDRATFYLLVVK